MYYTDIIIFNFPNLDLYHPRKTKVSSKLGGFLSIFTLF